MAKKKILNILSVMFVVAVIAIPALTVNRLSDNLRVWHENGVLIAYETRVNGEWVYHN